MERPPHYILGVDPGLKGGFALFKHGRLTDWWAMPRPSPTLLEPMLEMAQELPRATHVVMEALQLRGGQSAKGNASSAGNHHMVAATLMHFKLPVSFVHPATWSSELGRRGIGKAWALARAGKMIDCEILHDGIADAIMVGAWGVIKYGMDHCDPADLANLLAHFPHRKIALGTL